MEFLVVDHILAYRRVLGRPAFKDLWAVTSIHYLCMKFPTKHGIATVRGEQMGSRACYLNSLRKSEPRTVNVIITEVANEVSMDVKMLDAPEQGHISEQEEDVNMEEAPEQGHPLDELDPQIIDSKPNATPMEELEIFFANPDDPSQKRRALNPKRYEAIKDEVGKLSHSGFIRKAIYLKWISNSILVKKPSGKWRIPMFRPDEEATSFNTDRGLYCYKVMSFGLKNAGATYQRLVNMMIAELIGRTMEVYMDDMLVKSLEASEHKSKEVQSLNGQIAALSRFISRATNKSLPFFKVLKQGKKFQWISECEKAFQALKKHLGEAPLLSKPQPEESLLLYLAVSDVAVSAVLVREENERQLPVYNVSKSLLPAETRYPDMEKLTLALITASRRLRPYSKPTRSMFLPTSH
ncbi:uncharacterized protein LOC111384161 [Olea europaea var. sylvestris]|uniref:uncharacterized protein LOC111384161 n=1 Tax=Olea europaea var. sylvestris TaxID=158386 RepID=UPI000C1CFBE6|nr:uncharacterized protein LOC111384161 [Olea europaea var. sylvestris]